MYTHLDRFFPYLPTRYGPVFESTHGLVSPHAYFTMLSAYHVSLDKPSGLVFPVLLGLVFPSFFDARGSCSSISFGWGFGTRVSHYLLNEGLVFPYSDSIDCFPVF